MWAEEHDDRRKWLHTSHTMWATLAAAGAKDITPLTFFEIATGAITEPKHEPAQPLLPGDWAAIGQSFQRGGLPVTHG